MTFGPAAAVASRVAGSSAALLAQPIRAELDTRPASDAPCGPSADQLRKAAPNTTLPDLRHFLVGRVLPSSSNAPSMPLPSLHLIFFLTLPVCLDPCKEGRRGVGQGPQLDETGSYLVIAGAAGCRPQEAALQQVLRKGVHGSLGENRGAEASKRRVDSAGRHGKLRSLKFWEWSSRGGALRVERGTSGWTGREGGGRRVREERDCGTE